jgi:hypothetical protein
MILGFAEDFTSSVVLDSQLTAVPDSGMYYNSGVHESITLDNLLHFLPNLDFTFGTYAAGTTYGKFEDSRLRTDIVVDSGIIYQSITPANIGNTPASSPNNWLETNIESLRLKSFIFKVQDRVFSELKLNKRLVDNQYLYSVADTIQDTPTLLSGDYSGWSFEPKGSDYVAIKINEIGLQAPIATPVNLYVINQGVLKDTIVLNPTADGRLTMEPQTKILFGEKGKWTLAMDSQLVYTNQAYVDPLNYNGFVAYTVSGTGATAESSDYSITTMGNGLNFNITAYLDSDLYVSQNLVYFAKFIQVVFELEVLQVYLRNSNNKSNRQTRIQMSDALLVNETKDLTGNTVASKFQREMKLAIKQLEKTFDREISGGDNAFEISVGSH